MREQESAIADALSLPNLKVGVSRAKLMKRIKHPTLRLNVRFPQPELLAIQRQAAVLKITEAEFIRNVLKQHLAKEGAK